MSKETEKTKVNRMSKKIEDNNGEEEELPIVLVEGEDSSTEDEEEKTPKPRFRGRPTTRRNSSAPFLSKMKKKQILLEQAKNDAKVEFEEFRDTCLSKIPKPYKQMFGQIGFTKLYNAVMPCLILNPFHVPPGVVRQMWLDMFKKKDEQGLLKTMSYLIYWYGALEEQSMYGFISQKAFVPYETEAKKGAKGSHILPTRLADKAESSLKPKYKETVRAYNEMKQDLLLEPENRKRGIVNFPEGYDLLEIKDITDNDIEDFDELSDDDGEAEELSDVSSVIATKTNSLNEKKSADVSGDETTQTGKTLSVVKGSIAEFKESTPKEHKKLVREKNLEVVDEVEAEDKDSIFDDTDYSYLDELLDSDASSINTSTVSNVDGETAVVDMVQPTSKSSSTKAACGRELDSNQQMRKKTGRKKKLEDVDVVVDEKEEAMVDQRQPAKKIGRKPKMVKEQAEKSDSRKVPSETMVKSKAMFDADDADVDDEQKLFQQCEQKYLSRINRWKAFLDVNDAEGVAGIISDLVKFADKFSAPFSTHYNILSLIRQSEAIISKDEDKIVFKLFKATFFNSFAYKKAKMAKNFKPGLTSTYSLDETNNDIEEKGASNKDVIEISDKVDVNEHEPANSSLIKANRSIDSEEKEEVELKIKRKSAKRARKSIESEAAEESTLKTMSTKKMKNEESEEVERAKIVAESDESEDDKDDDFGDPDLSDEDDELYANEGEKLKPVKKSMDSEEDKASNKVIVEKSDEVEVKQSDFCSLIKAKRRVEPEQTKEPISICKIRKKRKQKRIGSEQGDEPSTESMSMHKLSKEESEEVEAREKPKKKQAKAVVESDKSEDKKVANFVDLVLCDEDDGLHADEEGKVRPASKSTDNQDTKSYKQERKSRLKKIKTAKEKSFVKVKVKKQNKHKVVKEYAEHGKVLMEHIAFKKNQKLYLPLIEKWKASLQSEDVDQLNLSLDEVLEAVEEFSASFMKYYGLSDLLKGTKQLFKRKEVDLTVWTKLREKLKYCYERKAAMVPESYKPKVPVQVESFVKKPDIQAGSTKSPATVRDVVKTSNIKRRLSSSQLADAVPKKSLSLPATPSSTTTTVGSMKSPTSGRRVVKTKNTSQTALPLSALVRKVVKTNNASQIASPLSAIANSAEEVASSEYNLCNFDNNRKMCPHEHRRQQKLQDMVPSTDKVTKGRKIDKNENDIIEVYTRSIDSIVNEKFHVARRKSVMIDIF